MPVEYNNPRIFVKKKKISKFEEPVGGIQASLFDTEGFGGAKSTVEWYPKIYKNEQDYIYILDKYIERGINVGYDLEKPKGKPPDIIGIGFYDPLHERMGEAASIPYSKRIANLTIDKTLNAGLKLVAHNGITSDKPWTERDLGRSIPLEHWIDTMYTHYGANMHLTKMASKDVDEDDEEGGGGAIGLMDLWAATRCLPLPVTNWKECRGTDCRAWGGPCPIHSKFDYNAMDSWAGSALEYYHFRYFKENNVPDSFIKHLHDIAYITALMQRQGIKIDLDFVDRFEHKWAKKVRRMTKLLPFNPKSEKEITEYFENLNKNALPDDRYVLPDTKKETIKKVLDDIGEGACGYKELNVLFNIKAAGKGPKSWFDSKYFVPHEDLTPEERSHKYFGKGRDYRYFYIHPRWVGTGTATLRLSSSKPNAQNIPSKGPLAELRKAIRASKGKQIVKADAKQLEVRIALYDYGVDPNKVLSLDPFTELVKLGNGVFEEVANRLNSDPKAGKKWKARDVAKSVAHGATNGEGLETATLQQLNSKRFETLEKNGAVRIFWDWRLGDNIVYSTGSNLSRRIFGKSSDANRKLALELLFDQYYKLIPQIPLWHRKVSDEVFLTNQVRGLGGSILFLDSPLLKEKMKAAFSVKTQGGGAYFMRDKLIEAYEVYNILPLLMVHDEIDYEVPETFDNKEVLESAKFLEGESRVLKGLFIPFEIACGPSWGETKVVTL